MNIKNNMKSLSIVKTLVVLFYVGHISSRASKLPPSSGEILNRNTRQLVTCPGFAGYCSEAYPGDTCTVVCAFGRNNVPECQPDGTWSDEPRCIEHEPGLEEQQTKLCPGIPGYCSDSPIGYLCEFDCLIGDDIRSVCTPDGTWDKYPTCEGDIRETRDGCDGCPGPFGGPRNRNKDGGNSGGGNGNKRKNSSNGGNRRNQGNNAQASRRSGGSGNGGNRRNGGNHKPQGGNRRNNGGRKNNRSNGGVAKTAAEELAAKAGGVVPGKLPQGRRPPKPKNFDQLLKGNSKFISNGNSNQKSNNNGRKNGNGNGRKNQHKSPSNGSRKNNNGNKRNNRPSNNKRPKSISNGGSNRNQNNRNNNRNNKRPSNNRKQQNRNNNFGQKKKGGSSSHQQSNKRKRPLNGQNRKQQQSKKNQKTSGKAKSGGGCSESQLESCIGACPSNIFGACADGCAQRCK